MSTQNEDNKSLVVRKQKEAVRAFVNMLVDNCKTLLFESVPLSYLTEIDDERISNIVDYQNLHTIIVSQGNIEVATDKVTRVEVIDQNGRSYVNWDEKNKVELSFQDDNRTLKIFITRDNAKDPEITKYE